MGQLKQALTFLGTLLVVAVVLAVAAPKAVHAVVAAAVQVMNTSANPVPTYNAGTRFQAEVCNAGGPVSLGVPFCGGNNSRSFLVPTITPSGAPVKQLVVDDVSGYCSSYNNATAMIIDTFLSGQFIPGAVANGEPSAAHHVAVAPPYIYVNGPTATQSVLDHVPESDYTFGRTTQFTFVPGDTVSLNFSAFQPGNSSIDGGCLARIEGTLVTQ